MRFMPGCCCEVCHLWASGNTARPDTVGVEVEGIVNDYCSGCESVNDDYTVYLIDEDYSAISLYSQNLCYTSYNAENNPDGNATNCGIRFYQYESVTGELSWWMAGGGIISGNCFVIYEGNYIALNQWHFWAQFTEKFQTGMEYEATTIYSSSNHGTYACDCSGATVTVTT